MCEAQDEESCYVPYSAFDIVAIGTSAGGLAALRQLLSGLPSNFPIPIMVVQHLDPDHSSQLAALLSRHAHLRIKEGEDGEPLDAGTVYIAPPGKHMLATSSRTVTLSQAPKEAFARPSVNLLFRSVAAAYGERVIGIVLTGRLGDGAKGAQAIKETGGRVIVQDKETSAAFGMPHTALEAGCVDFVLPIRKIAPAVISLVMVRGASSFFRASWPDPRRLLTYSYN